MSRYECGPHGEFWVRPGEESVSVVTATTAFQLLSLDSKDKFVSILVAGNLHKIWELLASIPLNIHEKLGLYGFSEQVLVFLNRHSDHIALIVEKKGESVLKNVLLKVLKGEIPFNGEEIIAALEIS